MKKKSQPSELKSSTSGGKLKQASVITSRCNDLALVKFSLVLYPGAQMRSSEAGGKMPSGRLNCKLLWPEIVDHRS